MIRIGAIVGAFALLLVGCGGGSSSSGGGTTPAAGAALPPFDAGAYLLQYGIAHGTPLRGTDTDIGTLEASRRRERDAEAKRALSRDLAFAHVFAAEHATGDDAVQHWNAVGREANAALRGNQDPTRAMEMAFALLWRAYRTEAADAPAVAERFAAYTTPSELVRIGWMVRGEIALRARDFANARAGFRYVLGDFEQPLYGFGLYRTAVAHREAGENAEATQSLELASELGCAAGAPDEVTSIARRAWQELGSPPRQGAPADKPWCEAAAPARRDPNTGLDLR